VIDCEGNAKEIALTPNCCWVCLDIMAAAKLPTDGLPSWSSSSYIANACLPRDASINGPVATLLSLSQAPNQCRLDGGSLIHQYTMLAIALVLFNLAMVAYFLPRAGDLDPINFDGEEFPTNPPGSSDGVTMLDENDVEFEYVDGPPPAGAVMMAPERDTSDE
jgi:hypothetical protein